MAKRNVMIARHAAHKNKRDKAKTRAVKSSCAVVLSKSFKRPLLLVSLLYLLRGWPPPILFMNGTCKITASKACVSHDVLLVHEMIETNARATRSRSCRRNPEPLAKDLSSNW